MSESPRTTVGQYLIESMNQLGLRHIFGIQGDYVLNFYHQLCESPLKVINTCDEQGAGFAADAYARIKGFGVVCVTYGVGGLKLANSTAQAFAESSPVLVISGAPGMAERKYDALLHHKVRSFDTQLNVFKEMTVAQAVLDDAGTAATKINSVLSAIIETKRPGYIELPRDMVQAEIDEPRTPDPEPRAIDQNVVDEALGDVMSMLSAAKRPVVVAGVEVHRFGLQSLLLEFLERSRLPFVTGLLGKSVVPEVHPQFIGVYAGGMSPDDVREAVEGSDCVIAIGPLVTDLATGIFTQHVDTGKSVVIGRHDVSVRNHTYHGVSIQCFLEALTGALPEPANRTDPVGKHEPPLFFPETGRKITIDRLLACLNTFLDDNTTVIAEPGDALFGALDLIVHGMTEFISPAYYASIGFAVPASIGVQFAAPDRRPLVLTGDGSFQMTGMELSVSARYGLSPIVIILNNGGYGTFRPICDGDFNDIPAWNYADIIQVIGRGEGYTVMTEDELAAALSAAGKNDSSPTIIDVRLGKYDCSERLRILARELRKKTG